MKSKWICEICEEEFDSQEDCVIHENKCDPWEYHSCTKCGEYEDWTKSNDGQGHRKEGWHKIYLGRMGYGSNLDGCDVNFELCDKCLCEFIETFKRKEYIHNSGSNSCGLYIDEVDEF